MDPSHLLYTLQPSATCCMYVYGSGVATPLATTACTPYSTVQYSTVEHSEGLLQPTVDSAISRSGRQSTTVTSAAEVLQMRLPLAGTDARKSWWHIQRGRADLFRHSVVLLYCAIRPLRNFCADRVYILYSTEQYVQIVSGTASERAEPTQTSSNTRSPCQLSTIIAYYCCTEVFERGASYHAGKG